MPDRPQKITLGEMRAAGIRGLLICCSDYRCSHSITVDAYEWPDERRLSDLEKRFSCSVCGRKGAEVTFQFWNHLHTFAVLVAGHFPGRSEAPVA